METKPTPPYKKFLTPGGIIVVLLCCVCSLGMLASRGDSLTETAENTAVPPTDGPSPTPTETFTPAPPTETPEPSSTLSPEVALQQAISDELGDNNRDISPMIASYSFDPATGLLEIQWAINDNLTDDLRIYGAQRDVATILRLVSESGLPYQTVHAMGTFSLVDNFGNITEEVVVNVTYSKATIDMINWDNFLNDNVYEIADTAVIHPEFR